MYDCFGGEHASRREDHHEMKCGSSPLCVAKVHALRSPIHMPRAFLLLSSQRNHASRSSLRDSQSCATSCAIPFMGCIRDRKSNCSDVDHQHNSHTDYTFPSSHKWSVNCCIHSSDELTDHNLLFFSLLEAVRCRGVWDYFQSIVPVFVARSAKHASQNRTHTSKWKTCDFLL